MGNTMTSERCEMSKNYGTPKNFRCENSKMSFTAEAVRDEMQEHVRAVAALGPADNRKAALQFAAKVLCLPFSRVHCLFYGKARRVEAHEADQIRAYVQATEKLIQARAKYEADRKAFLEAHPSMGRFAPGPLAEPAVPEAAAAAPVNKGIDAA